MYAPNESVAVFAGRSGFELWGEVDWDEGAEGQLY